MTIGCQKRDTRKTVKSMLGAVGVVAALSCSSSFAATYVYVSNAEDQTISRYQLDESTGSLDLLGYTKTGGTVMPLAHSPDKRHLYAALRSKPYRLLSYRINAANGNLVQAGQASLPVSMANIDTDKSGRFLLSASYGDHLVAISPITTQGVVGAVSAQYPTGQNAHAVHASPDNRYVYSTSLGDDELMQFALDSQQGVLKPLQPAAVKAQADMGPRHFVFSPDQQFVYVLGELSGQVMTYRYHAETGQLTALHTLNALQKSGMNLLATGHRQPSDEEKTHRVWAADLHISPDGQYLYLSERTRSQVLVLKVDPKTGKLSYTGRIQVATQPRGFNLTPDGKYLIVSGQKDTTLGVYRINPDTGMPEWVSEAQTGKGANWVEVVDLP